MNILNPINNLLLWQRFFLIGISAMILGGMPTYMYIQESQKTLEFIRYEQRGVKPLKQLMLLYKAVQDDRGLAVQLLSGITTIIDQRTAKQKEIDELIMAIDIVAKKDHWTDELKKYWEPVKTGLELIATTVAQRSVSAMDTRKHHHEALAKINKFRALLTEEYGLSLDSDKATAHIIHAVTYDIISVMEPIGKLRGTGADILVRATVAKPTDTITKKATETELANLILLVNSTQDGLTMLITTLKNAIVDDPSLNKALDTPLQQVTSAVVRIVKLVETEIISANVITYNAIEYRKIASEGVNIINDLNQILLNQLDDYLQIRITKLAKMQIKVLSWVLIIIVLGTLLSFLVMQSILKPINHLILVMNQIAEGNFNTRSHLNTSDEIGLLSNHFNRMLDEREEAMQRIFTEHEQLNNSVIILLQAVAQLSQKDLNVHVPVALDVTGPLSDALNLLTSEMARALQRISDIAENVTQASISVQEQADLVSNVAKSEREQVEKTAEELDNAASTMLRIAELAQTTNVAADKASQTTRNALTTVGATITGIEHIRENIRYAGAKIERLGINSQEISSVVDLIGGIARRTQILAVSASMHAASAGEAGQGFQVIANEVQRLAETAQQAAAKIGTQLTNIQAEVTNTVVTVNNVIKQVVDGSRLAEQAGEQMRLTQNSTADLVTAVQTIAESSQEQANASANLLSRAQNIRKSTQLTSKQLKAQTVQTENLVRYARNLLDVVQVFKLPN